MLAMHSDNSVEAKVKLKPDIVVVGLTMTIIGSTGNRARHICIVEGGYASDTEEKMLQKTHTNMTTYSAFSHSGTSLY